jgi:biopolymer transport protein ExbD
MSKKALAKSHDNPDSEVNLGIIITPFLDMSFQLLAFFIMIYQPSAFEGHIDGKLLPPEKIMAKGSAKTPTEKKPDEISNPDLDPAVKDAVLVVVKSYDPVREAGKNPEAREKAKKIKEGMPLQILVKTPEATEMRELAGEGDTIEKGWEKMALGLKEIQKTLAPLGKGKTIIKLMPDGGLRHQYLVKAWDICKYAGFDSVGFVPPPDLPQSGAPMFKKPVD